MTYITLLTHLSRTDFLNEPISVLRVVGCFCFFYFKFKSVASDQGLHCLPMSHKRTLGLYGLTVLSVIPLGHHSNACAFTI